VATNYRNTTTYRTSALDYRGLSTGGDATVTATAVAALAAVGTVTLSTGSTLAATTVAALASVGAVDVTAVTTHTATSVSGLTVIPEFTERHALVVMGGASKQGVWV